MDSRFYFTVLVCAGVSVCPMQTGAQEGHIIDLRNLVAPPFATANTPAPAPTVEQPAHDRIINRRLHYRQRRSAMRHVTRLRRFAHIDFDTISKAYHAKKNALFRMVTSQRTRRQQITLAKHRAVTEVRALATAIRERFEAEERSMAAVIRKMREENPQYADQALRQAVTTTEKRAGETITETENLPLLSKTVDLSYVDPIRRTEKRSELPAKLTIPIRPITSTHPGLKPSISLIEPHNTASLKDAAELEALIAYKKQKALERAKQVKQQTKQSQVSATKDEKTQKLRDLVELYVTGTISSEEYLRRREWILVTTTPQDKE